MKKRYIAYGSNMDEGQMAFRCPTAKLIGKAEIQGYQLMFKGSMTGAYATIEPKCGGMVPMLIWEIGAEDERNLDRYEGYPIFYYKKNIPVTLDGKKINGMAYIMDERRELGIPRQEYYNMMRKAYQKFGFDMKILKAAYRLSQENTVPEKTIV